MQLLFLTTCLQLFPSHLFLRSRHSELFYYFGKSYWSLQRSSPLPGNTYQTDCGQGAARGSLRSQQWSCWHRRCGIALGPRACYSEFLAWWPEYRSSLLLSQLCQGYHFSHQFSTHPKKDITCSATLSLTSWRLMVNLTFLQEDRQPVSLWISVSSSVRVIWFTSAKMLSNWSFWLHNGFPSAAMSIIGTWHPTWSLIELNIQCVVFGFVSISSHRWPS